ncbi:glycine--tRNA ligase subunit beta [uncultured Sphingomonas sp.]|uniref:glycine--tRNA ligase subunit beta n=1 Tax=uncultured Sphingomonas sp. TaxID=158754 RepID=UPI0035CAD7B1
MPDLLLELRSEEIPARMQAKAQGDLARLFTAELAAAGVTAGELITYATPRRLALIARDLPTETAAATEEVKGPRASAPPQALEGFLRKTGLTRDQLTERDGVLYAMTAKPGRLVIDVLAQAIPAIVRAFPWPKSMRWGAASTTTESLRWVRPLQGIVALFGDEIVPCQVAGIPAGAATVGHRFHHPGPITLRGADDYVEKLRACHVVVDPAERAQTIALGATLAANKAGLTLVRDEGLLAENAGLTEWPVPLLGRFDEAFLDVPPEVIRLTARVNQKYFVCHDSDGKLANAFLCTANIDADDDGKRIIEGNRKVLAARLSDARFFYDQDLKVPLEEQARKLDRIVFHEKLGTVADKVDRVAKLARWLMEEGIVPSPSPPRGEGLSREPAAPGTAPLPDPLPASGEREQLADLAERAARLCKADLVTGMVGEFPELQGLMGGYYAAAQGEHPAVAQAIRDHYKPVGQGDAVPTAPVTVAVSLADKLDTFYSFFAAVERPTGSRDPFALRRAGLAIISLLQSNNIRFRFAKIAEYLHLQLYRSLRERRMPHVEILFEGKPDINVINFAQVMATPAWYLYDDDPLTGIAPSKWTDEQRRKTTYLIDLPSMQEDGFDFLVERLKVQQREAGVRHDLIDAVFALGGEDDLVRLLARVRALQGFVGTEDGANLLGGYKRAANILKKEGWTASSPSPLWGEGAEKNAVLHA